jgi:hypothetical protein
VAEATVPRQQSEPETCHPAAVVESLAMKIPGVAAVPYKQGKDYIANTFHYPPLEEEKA